MGDRKVVSLGGHLVDDLLAEGDGDEGRAGAGPTEGAVVVATAASEPGAVAPETEPGDEDEIERRRLDDRSVRDRGIDPVGVGFEVDHRPDMTEGELIALDPGEMPLMAGAGDQRAKIDFPRHRREGPDPRWRGLGEMGFEMTAGRGRLSVGVIDPAEAFAEPTPPC